MTENHEPQSGSGRVCCFQRVYSTAANNLTDGGGTLLSAALVDAVVYSQTGGQGT